MNKIYGVVLKDSLLGCPFVPDFKPIDPLVGGAVIGAIGNVLGGLFGSSSQSSANATNLEIAKMNAGMQRETNQLQAELQREVNRQNYAMYEDSKMWNSITSQMARAKNAGINPLTALGKSAETNPVSQMQAPQLTAPQLDARMQAYDWSGAFSGVGNAVIQGLIGASQADVNKSQANYNNVKAEIEQQKSVAEIAQMMSHVNKNSAEYKLLEQNLKLARATMADQVAQIHSGQLKTAAEVDKIRAERFVIECQRDLLTIDKEFRFKFNAAQLRSMDAGIEQAYAAARLHDASAVKAHAESAVAGAQKTGLDIDNKQKAKMVDAIVQRAYYEADKAQYEAGVTRTRYVFGKTGEMLGAGVSDSSNAKRVKVPDYSHYSK